MTGTNAPQVVLAVVLVAGLSALAAVRRRRQLLALSPALDPGSVRLEGSPFPRSLCGRYQQRAVEFRRPAGKSDGAMLQAWLDCASNLEFEVVRKGVVSRFTRAIHLEKGVETGDPDLDRRFTFLSREPERLAGWLRSSESARRAVETLFEQYRFGDLQTDGRTLRAERTGLRCMPSGPADAREILELLRTLAESAERA
jgi:hypothetical protein